MVVEAVPEGKYVTVTDGLTMHYHEAGTGERGTVLFIHGSGPGASGWSNYKRNYPVLAEAGYRTLVPDTLGYGYSSKPEDGDYGLDYLAGAAGTDGTGPRAASTSFGRWRRIRHAPSGYCPTDAPV